MVELSVIIPTLKPPDEVESVSALKDQSYSDYEVLIQREDSATKARNEGIRRANADKLVFLDDDSIPEDGYLERVADLLDREAVVTGKIVHPRSDVIAQFTTHYDRGNEPKYVTRFWGCNAACRTEVFDSAGMWNEQISWGHEEKELAERILRHYPIYYDPELVVIHSYADSIRDYWRKQYQLELQTPYLWDKEGISATRQWFNILLPALNPTNYVGLSPEHTIARAGGNVARLLGRTRGMLRKRNRTPLSVPT
ncbi:glycosyltransferase family 2 protein (plasmid) [Haloferax sp. S1W]|uniref:glycosyltransferase family 2 protein n=1 Tax=Haloferax sp. S1W TaxID=3377110 RepID=UPI0037C7937F